MALCRHCDTRVDSRAKISHCVGTACALRAYCAHREWDTHPRIPVTCLLGGRPKGVNTIGLARCPSILLVVVITNSIVEEELSGPGVDSPPSSIGDREPSSDHDHVDFSAVVDVAIPIDDLEHLGSRITLKTTKVLVPHPKCLGSQKNHGTEPKTCEKGPKLGFEYLPTSKTSQCVRTACMAFPRNRRTERVEECSGERRRSNIRQQGRGARPDAAAKDPTINESDWSLRPWCLAMVPAP